MLIDCSGSMSAEVDGSGGRTRMDFAKQSAAETATALLPGDELMIVAFGDKPSVVLGRTEITRITDLGDRIARLSPDEQRTEAGPALSLAATQLTASHADVTHVVIVTDGEIHDADYTASVARSVAEQGITVSVIWLVTGTSRSSSTARIARFGGGRSVPTGDIAQVPALVSVEVNRALNRTSRRSPQNKDSSAPPPSRPDGSIPLSQQTSHSQDSQPHASPDLDSRITDLERRVMKLEQLIDQGPEAAQRAGLPTTPTRLRDAPASQPNTADKSAFIVPVTIQNKRFYPRGLGRRGEDPPPDRIVWDSYFNFSHLEKPARAIKGTLEVTDLFGEVKIRIGVTLYDSVQQLGTHKAPDIAFVYDRSNQSHVWIRTAEEQHLHAVFKVQSILYQDGTRAEFN